MTKTESLTEKYLLRVFRFAVFVEKGLNSFEDLYNFIQDIENDYWEERINILEESINEC